jgi:Rad3-related DNA helicase
MTSLPFTPADLGLPSKFGSWRRHQDGAIQRTLDSEKRFIAQNGPTGFGKSAVYVALSQLMGRTCVVTSTKGLQEQLVNDFGGMGMVDIRGRSNYPCRLSPGLTCEDGMHIRCQYQGGEDPLCPRRAQHKKAEESPLVVTNYACWIADHRYGSGLGKFDLLVLDEVHDAPTEVCDAMSTHFSTEEVYHYLNSQFPADDASMEVWRRWARELLPKAEREVEELDTYIKECGGMATRRDIKRLVELKSLAGKLETIATSVGQWVAEASMKGGYTLDPVWPAEHAESLLFLGIPKVLLVSASAIPKTLQLMGISESDYEFQYYPAVFPASRNPFIYVPTVAVDHRTFATVNGRSNGNIDLWLMRIDQLIGDRLDRKGIVHTVSYNRKNLILERSEWAEYMVSHTSLDTGDQIRRFKSAPPPAVLLSPSVDTGYDFPFTQAEYQIICKVPYPDTRSRVMTARCNSKTGDPLYAPYLTAQRLVQSCGRDMRAVDDRGENIIIDDKIRGFLAAYKGLLPKWFLALYKRSDGLPEPPPKLERRETK